MYRFSFASTFTLLLCSQVYVFAQDFQEVTYQGVPLEVVRAAENPVTNELAIALERNPIVIWDAESQSIVREFADIHLEWESLAYSPDGTLLAGGAYDGTTVIYDAASGQVLHTEVVQGPAQNVSFSPDSSKLVISGRWILDTSSYVLTPLSEAYSTCIGVGGAYLPQTNRLFTAGYNNYCVWDTTDLSVITESEYVDGAIVAIAASPAGDSVVITSKSAQPDALILDPDGNIRHRLALGESSTGLGQVHFSADGSTLALTGGGISSPNKDVIIVEPLSGEVLTRYNDTTLQSPLNYSIYGSTIVNPDTLLLVHGNGGLNFLSLEQEAVRAAELREIELAKTPIVSQPKQEPLAPTPRPESFEELSTVRRDQPGTVTPDDTISIFTDEATLFGVARNGPANKVRELFAAGFGADYSDRVVVQSRMTSRL